MSLSCAHKLISVTLCGCVRIISGDLQYWIPNAVCAPGVIPDKVRLDMPAEAWYNDMRTPAAEILLAECRKQRDGLPGTSSPDADHALLESAEGANTGTLSFKSC